jgi:hypothetical protein
MKCSLHSFVVFVLGAIGMGQALVGCSSLSDYMPKTRIQGKIAAGRYVAVDGRWSVEMPEPVTAETNTWIGQSLTDNLTTEGQTTVAATYPVGRQAWTLDVIPRDAHTKLPVSDPKFIRGWFEWVALSGPNGEPDALQLVEHADIQFDGQPAQLVASARRSDDPQGATQARYGLLVDRDPFWVVCMVQFEPTRALKSPVAASNPEFERFRPALEAFARSFRAETPAAKP